MQWFASINTRSKSEKKEGSVKSLYVTLGWDGLPTIGEDGYILPREAELILRREYYPNWPKEKWPIDSITKEKIKTKHEAV